MNNLNSILLEGNLVRDPESRKTPKGTPVCHFSLATNRYRKDADNEVSFFDVEVWAKQATACQEYLSKGRGVRIIGRLKQDRWTDPAGKTRSRVKVVGDHVEFKPIFNPAKQGKSQVPETEKKAGAVAEEVPAF